MSLSNLPPGVSDSDIERDANGSCPECGRILNDGRCKCGWNVERELNGDQSEPCGGGSED